MTIEVENVPINHWHGKGREERNWREFVQTLKDLKKGQSFLWKIASNDRMAIAMAGVLLDRRFRSAKEGELHRIGRVG